MSYTGNPVDREDDRTNYHICTYFYGVQIFAIFANEPQTAKSNTRENLSWHCFTTCIRPTAISWTPKAIKNIDTLIMTHTECISLY